MSIAPADVLENSSPDGSAWPQVRLVKLAVEVKWRRPNLIPGPVLANVLRGALGMSLRQLVCPQEWFDHECSPCPLFTDCAYAQTYAPSPGEDATQMRLQADLPRPFVITPPGLHPDSRPTPAGLTFSLMLFGSAVDRLPFFVGALERLGREGMGRDRTPFELASVTALHPAGDEVLFTAGAASLKLPGRAITTSDIVAPGLLTAPRSLHGESTSQTAQAMATKPRIRLRFLTPTLLRSGSGLDAQGRRIPAREIRDRPPLGVVARRLRDRLSALCLFFGEPWRRSDFAELGAQADRARLIDSRTVWLTRTRHSTRTGDRHELSGFVGEATYEFESQGSLAAVLPLLHFGPFLHVGKHAPWGNGAIETIS